MNMYLKQATVGLLVLLGIAAFLGGTLWLRGKSLASPDVNVIFENIGNLKERAPVRVSGAAIGRVSKIAFQGVGKVYVGLNFDEELPMTKSATIMAVGIGVLGDMVIDIDPGHGAPLEPSDTLRGSMAVGLFDQATPLIDKAGTALTSLNRMLDTNLVIDLRRTMVSADRLMRYYGDATNGPAAQVNATMTALQSTMRRLDSTLAQVDPRALQARLDTTLRSATDLTTRLSAASGHIDSLMVKILRGEGTLGKLASDSLLYGDLRKTLQTFNDLLAEIKKNPGKIGITVKLF